MKLPSILSRETQLTVDDERENEADSLDNVHLLERLATYTPITAH